MKRKILQTTRDERAVPGGRRLSLEFRAEGAEPVPAVLLLPTAAAPAPAAVLLHGYTSRKEHMADGVGAVLLRHGIGSLALDLPLHGSRANPVQAQSTRNPLEVLRHWRAALADAALALRYLGARAEVDAARLALVGYSLGSFLAVSVAADEPRARAVVLAAGGDLPAGTPFALLGTPGCRPRSRGAPPGRPPAADGTRPAGPHRAAGAGGAALRRRARAQGDPPVGRRPPPAARRHRARGRLAGRAPDRARRRAATSRLTRTRFARPMPCLSRPRRLGGCLAALAALLLGPGHAGAQLRPLEPFDFSVFDAGRALGLSLGASLLSEQRASLAGTQGRLVELGTFAALWRRDGAALELGGTALRRLDHERVFAEPAGGTRPPGAASRRDAGDMRVAMALRLTPPAAPALAVLRFGTRLPTTDNAVGLERDQMDFFALLGGQVHRAGLRAAVEGGLGIHGTRYPDDEQVDVVLATARLGYRRGGLTSSLALTGQWNGQSRWRLRGNEDLAELRAGLRAGGRTWVQAQWVKGLAEFSPRHGLLLSVGLER